MEAEPYRANDEFIGGGYEGDIAAGADARAVGSAGSTAACAGGFQESESCPNAARGAAVPGPAECGVEMQELKNVELGENLL